MIGKRNLIYLLPVFMNVDNVADFPGFCDFCLHLCRQSSGIGIFFALLRVSPTP